MSDGHALYTTSWGEFNIVCILENRWQNDRVRLTYICSALNALPHYTRCPYHVPATLTGRRVKY